MIFTAIIAVTCLLAAIVATLFKYPFPKATTNTTKSIPITDKTTAFAYATDKSLSLLEPFIIDSKRPVVKTLIMYGSRIYGTATSKSDYDIYVVVSSNNLDVPALQSSDMWSNTNSSIDLHDPCLAVDVTVLLDTTFQENLYRCEVKECELIFTPSNFVSGDLAWLVGMKSLFLDKLPSIKGEFRKEFSMKADQSNNRGLKKMKDCHLAMDGDDAIDESPNHLGILGLKSIWHTYRIYKFALEIGASSGEIDFSCANDGWENLGPLMKKVHSGDKVSLKEMKDFHKLFCKTPGYGDDGKLTLVQQFKQTFPK